MAELKIKDDDVVGIKKEIEEGSLELIFNALQSDIYSFPIKSFVRETISNSLDSVIEKNVFRKIDAGDPVEKYFRQKQDGALLKDSEYNPNYYDTNFLSMDDKVHVVYTHGSPRDKISITDNGVGLGDSRLRGFFKVGYSTKRNFFTARGLFGLGSKSALATGVDYFLLTTVYNGYKTVFMVYNRDYENISPETPGGKTDIWRVTMANDAVIDKPIYWEKTSEKNSVTIEVEVKKHNKDTYIAAVKDQFQYFSGAVHFTETSDQGYNLNTDNLDEKPEFESDHLLIPKYSTYSVPHILVDGISYGPVSWEELELEKRTGKIALKLSANDVDITQSRETLKWTDKTKQAVLRVVRIAEDEASEFVRHQLAVSDEDNVFALNNSHVSGAHTGASNVTSTFSRFLAIHNIRPKYVVNLGDKPGDKISAVLGGNLFEFLFYSYDFRKVYTVTEGKRLKIKTETLRSFQEISNCKIIQSHETMLGPRLAEHLLNKYDVSSFVYVRENTTRIKSIISLTKTSKEFSTNRVKEYALNLLKNYADLCLDNYEVVYDETEEDEDNLDEKVLDDNKVNQAKLRKMNKEVMWYEYDLHTWWQSEPQFRRDKNVVKIDQIRDHFGALDVVIVPSSYTKLGKMLLVVDDFRITKNKIYPIFVSEENANHFMKAGYTHVTNYLRTLNTKTGELMIGEKIVELNTIWQFKKLLNKYIQFSSNSEIISKLSNINRDVYDRLAVQHSKSLKEVLKNSASGDMPIVEEILSYLDNLAAFQTVVESKDKEKISAKAMELFNTTEIHNIYAYDKEYIDAVEEELEKLSPIAPLINSISYYSEDCTPLLKLLLETIHKNKEEND